MDLTPRGERQHDMPRPTAGFRIDGQFDGIPYTTIDFNNDGTVRRPTSKGRIKRYERIMRTPCPTCNAQPGRPCWWANGPKLHGARFRKAQQR